MAKVTYTEAASLKLKKPVYIVATEWQDTDTEAASGDVWILEDVVRDTTSISQDDNDETDIDRETNDDPIDTIYSKGKYQVSAEVADRNADLLAALAGYTIDETTGDAYAPGKYEDKYIQLDTVYKIGENDDGSDKLMSMRVPKLKLATKDLIESLNSNLARINLAGTARNIKKTVNGKVIDSPFVQIKTYTLPTADSTGA